MSINVGIVNFGVAGNIFSIKKALNEVGANVVEINSEHQFSEVEKIVLPGVGCFKSAMKDLDKSGLLGPLKASISSKPTLGICLGMQILATIGYEQGKTNGLGVVTAEVKPMICNGKVPHMGFSPVNVVGEQPLLEGVDGEEFYFMHSFEVVNYTDIAALTSYSGHQFVSAISSGNIYGVQFHPEKSRLAGLRVFRNFLSM